MAKKHREITVNGTKFAWTIAILMREGTNVKELRIWKDKQIVSRTLITAGDEVTPSLVEKVIQRRDL